MYYAHSKLINDDVPSEDGIQEPKKCTLIKHYYCFIIFIILCSLVFQVISFFYLYEIAMAAKNIDMYAFNQSDTEQNIDKLKKIINYVCENENIC